MDFNEYNILGNIMNTTWGVGSTNNNNGATMSLKASFMGGSANDDKKYLLLSYCCVITFGQPQERVREMKRLNDESFRYINASIGKIKKEFKEESGRTLKVEKISDDEDYELLSLGQYSGRRDALYRRKVVLEIE